MALKDIITAIVAEAERDIAQLRANHKNRVDSMREQYEKDVGALRLRLEKQLTARRDQLHAKTSTHSAVERRNRLAAAKQEALDAVFAETVKRLSALPDGQAEPILRACLDRIKDKGTILPSRRHATLLKKLAPSGKFTFGEPIEAEGGFRFVGTASDADYTFEHLVHGVLRPMKGLDIAKMLFPA